MWHTIVTLKEPKNCYHCGDKCPPVYVELDDKPFCCNGCSTVYSILSEADLCDFYQLDEKPGISLKSKNYAQKFDYLNNPEILKELLVFDDAGIQSIKLYIPQIHCSSCIWLLENLYKLNELIISSNVNFPKKEICVTYRSEGYSLKLLVELLATLGYEPQISINKNREKSKADKVLLYKVGIAGFCFGNIMLLSFPEYLSLDINTSFGYFFGYLNLILSIPVICYSASDYFKSAWAGIKSSNINIDVPISLGISVLFIRSAVEIVLNSGAGYMDSLAGLVFFLLIGKWYQDKTYRSLSFENDYRSYFPIAVSKLIDNNEESTPIKKLRSGDRILIRNNEIIPTDSILESDTTTIDYSFVTGEQDLIPKKKGDLIYAGGKQVGASIVLKVDKKVAQSYLTQLWNNTAFTKKQDLSIESSINKVSKYFTAAILLIALITGLVWYFLDASIMLNAFTSVLIIACPCALALTVPFAYGNVLRIVSKYGLFLKNIQVVEQIQKLTDLVFDKTGTLTVASSKQSNYEGIPLSENELHALTSLTNQSIHPISKSINSSLSNQSDYLAVNDYQEHLAKGITGTVNNMRIEIGSTALIKSANQELSGTYVSIDGELKGKFNIQSQYREGLEEMIQQLSQVYQLHVLSGDNDNEKLKLSTLFRENNNLHFNQKPEDKLNFIESLQKKGKKVMMLGDGLNDAGALKQSDVGISIADNIYTFTPSCDAILDAASFSKLNLLVHYIKNAKKVVTVSFILSFLYNLVGLAFAVSGQLTPLVAAILMPLSSITIVLFVTIATSLLANTIFNKVNNQ